MKERSRSRVIGFIVLFFFQAEDGIRDDLVTGVQTCALPISRIGRCSHIAGHGSGIANDRRRAFPWKAAGGGGRSGPRARRACRPPWGKKRSARRGASPPNAVREHPRPRGGPAKKFLRERGY